MRGEKRGVLVAIALVIDSRHAPAVSQTASHSVRLRLPTLVCALNEAALELSRFATKQHK